MGVLNVQRSKKVEPNKYPFALLFLKVDYPALPATNCRSTPEVPTPLPS